MMYVYFYRLCPVLIVIVFTAVSISCAFTFLPTSSRRLLALESTPRNDEEMTLVVDVAIAFIYRFFSPFFLRSDS